MCTVTGRRPMRRIGVVTISLVTLAVAPVMSRLLRWATIPLGVRMQVASAVATKSVGEKASPLPMLSFGASGVRVPPLGPWGAVGGSGPVWTGVVSTIALM